MEVAQTTKSLSQRSVSEKPWDGWLLLAVCALLGIGVVMVYSASAVTSGWNNQPTLYLTNQLTFMALGFVSLGIALKVDYRWYQRFVYVILGITVLLLLLVAFAGTTVNNSTRWLRIGSFNMQPGEIAKVSIIMVLAYSVAKKQDKIKSFTIGLLPHFIIVGFVVCLLMMQPDFGTSIIICALMMIMLFVAGTRLSYILATLVLGVLGAVFLVMQSKVRMQRMMAFFDPWSHQQDIAYQVTESMITIGSGGIDGRGLGNGLGKLGFVPELHTDFIGTALAEEFGFIGICTILILFLIVVWRGFIISLRARDNFGRYLALGITVLLGLEASINLCVISGLLPTKGLTLPFVSYGGSSMLCSMFAVGILLNISKCAEDKFAIRQAERAAEKEQARWEKKRARIMSRRKEERSR